MVAITLFFVSPASAAVESSPLGKSLAHLSKTLDTRMSSMVVLDRALDRKAAGLAPSIINLQKIRGDLKSASVGMFAAAGNCKRTLEDLKRQEKARATLLNVLDRTAKWSVDLRSSGLKGANQVIAGKEAEAKKKANNLLSATIWGAMQVQLGVRTPRASLASLESLYRDLGCMQGTLTKKTELSGVPTPSGGQISGDQKAEKVLPIVRQKPTDKERFKMGPGPINCGLGYSNAPTGGCVKDAKTEKQLAIEKSFVDNPMKNQPAFYKPLCMGPICVLKYQSIKGPLFKTNADGSPIVSTSDVDQGEIGDCYVMASMAAIANKNPDLIRDMVQQNQDGTYSVKLYDRFGGTPSQPKLTTLTFDNKFPVNSLFNTLAYERSSDADAMWPMVIEKAYAKLNGNSYDLIGNGGRESVALEVLTGVKSREYRPSEISLDTIAKWDKAGYAITVGTLQNGHKNDLLGILNDIASLVGVRSGSSAEPLLFKNQTLVPTHAYYVESVDVEKGTVTLGNPWGFDRPHVTLTMDQLKQYISVVTVNPIEQAVHASSGGS